jgi:hypothetical protein
MEYLNSTTAPPHVFHPNPASTFAGSRMRTQHVLSDGDIICHVRVTGPDANFEIIEN